MINSFNINIHDINSFNINIQGILIGDYDVTEHRSTLKIFIGHSTISPTNVSGSNECVSLNRDINMVLKEIDDEIYLVHALVLS
ncbi:MAG: hypothetical protein WBQ16_03560 [Nitrososphaeraceae archaeon]